MKSPWEKRVGMLLDPEQHNEFLYSYKPVDSQHGGQPKLDWFACDLLGRFWLIEVKWLPDNRRSINLMTEVSAGQREALTAVALSETGISLLAVGQRDSLRIFDWREVMTWMTTAYHATVEEGNVSLLLPIDGVLRTLRLRWTGPKSWDHSLYDLVVEWLCRDTATSPPLLGKPSPERASSASILKLADYTPTLPLMRPLEP